LLSQPNLKKNSLTISVLRKPQILQSFAILQLARRLS